MNNRRSRLSRTTLKNFGASLVFVCILLLGLRYILNLTATEDFLINENLINFPNTYRVMEPNRNGVGLLKMKSSNLAFVGLLGPTGGEHVTEVLLQVS